MSDMYRDTDERMRNDCDFRAAVECMMAMARQSGFTPGELKQIAFRAAYELELRRPPGPVHIPETGQTFYPKSDHPDAAKGEG